MSFKFKLMIEIYIISIEGLTTVHTEKIEEEKKNSKYFILFRMKQESCNLIELLSGCK